MKRKVFQVLIVAIMIFSIFVPNVYAYTITLKSEVIEPFYNETIAYEYLPYVVDKNLSSIEPKIIFYAIYNGTGEYSNYFIVFYMFFWNKQVFYIFKHKYDFEPYIVLVNSKTKVIEKIAYDRWHYLVGRNNNPMYYSFNINVNISSNLISSDNSTNRTINVITNSVPIKIIEGYRSFRYTENFTMNKTHFQKFVYSTKLKILNDDLISLASSTIGFDSKIYENPFLVFEKGVLFYKVISFWNSISKAILTMSDEKLQSIDFSNENNTWTKVFTGRE